MPACRASKIELPPRKGRRYLFSSMRLLSFALLLAVPCLRAADVPDRNAAYERIRAAEQVQNLVERTGKDIGEGRFVEALAAADAALKIAPDSPATLNAKAAALIELGKFDDAAKLLDRATGIDGSYMPARFNRAESLMRQKKYFDSAAEFRQLLSDFPSNPLVKFKLYLAYHCGGRDDLAKQVAGSLLFPSDGPAWYYANAAEKTLAGDKSAARKLIRAARSIHPKDAPQYDEALRNAGIAN